LSPLDELKREMTEVVDKATVE